MIFTITFSFTAIRVRCLLYVPHINQVRKEQHSHKKRMTHVKIPSYSLYRMNFIYTAIVIVLCVWAISISLNRIADSISLDTYRAQALKQFMEYRTHSSTLEFILIGSEAEIIKSSEDIVNNKGWIMSYSLTCYARNAHGEYFMFVSNYEDKPFCKHISHANAKLILEHKYREPI